MTPKRLRNFLLGQRVFVHQNNQGHRLGIYGVVRRLRRGDDLAWIELKVRSANPNAHPFPEGDHRANHVLVAPEDCEQSTLGLRFTESNTGLTDGSESQSQARTVHSA